LTAPPPVEFTAEATPEPSFPVPPAPVIDRAALIQDFRSSLREASNRQKRYPQIARENAWEGEVAVRIEIGADGSLAALRVRSSSGYRALDQQAVATLRKALSSLQVPQALLGKPFSIDLRVVFKLSDQDSG
jgi:periplasmic protein TonB